jgi:hypothetical protein
VKPPALLARVERDGLRLRVRAGRLQIGGSPRARWRWRATVAEHRDALARLVEADPFRCHGCGERVGTMYGLPGEETCLACWVHEHEPGDPRTRLVG